MKLLLPLLCLAIFAGDEIPYKAKEEYELKLEFQFKGRPVENGTYKVALEYERTNQSSGPLPYLMVHFVVLKQNEDEVKLRVVDSGYKVVTNRKIEKGKKISLELGFTDDLKDHTIPHEYSFLFISADKEVKRRVVIHFESDGTYLVNNEKRGKI